MTAALVVCCVLVLVAAVAVYWGVLYASVEEAQRRIDAREDETWRL
jgi:CHASE3 domain sensor protein